MMNQIRRCEAEPDALMALPSDTFPLSVYAVAFTACAACHHRLLHSPHLCKGKHKHDNF